MHKILFSLMAVFMFSIVSYAGQWTQDENGLRYQNDDGTYKTGWHQDADGRWYYLSDDTAYMLTSTITPDGYSVGVDGVWGEGGDSGVSNNASYDNKVDLVVTAYENITGINQMGYSVPVTVYYNNSYLMEHDVSINVIGVEVTKDGVPYINFTINSDTMLRGHMSTKCIHNLSDGTVTEIKGSITGERGKENNSYPLLTRIKRGDLKTTAIEIYIETE